MTAFEQQVLRALNETALQIAHVKEGMGISLVEILALLAGPLLSVGIAIWGWHRVEDANRRTNHYAFVLQLKDAARNRILGALYEYENFLDDLESPGRLILQDESLLKAAYLRPGGQLPSAEYVAAYLGKRVEIQVMLRNLGYFDRRRSECFKTLHRDAWIIQSNVDLTESVDKLEKRETQILDAFYSYMKGVNKALEGGPKSGIQFLLKDRDPESLRVIVEQTVCVDGVILSLQKELTDDSESQKRHGRPSRGERP
jgi:hypothetical protein